MSRNIFINLISTLRSTILNSPFSVATPNEIVLKTMFFFSCVGLHCSYAIRTERTEAIEVTKRYKMVRHGMTEFMIIDQNGRHFNVNTSLWYWKWDALETWSSLPQKAIVTYYGVRSPVFGIFPNIIGIKKGNW